MYKLSKLAVVLSTVAACSLTFAAATDSDQARRQRNVDEVMAKHNLNADGSSNGTHAMPAAASHKTMRERTHSIAEKTREETHEAAEATRDFTHRQLDKARDFSAHQDAKFPTKAGRVPAKQQEGQQN